MSCTSADAHSAAAGGGDARGVEPEEVEHRERRAQAAREAEDCERAVRVARAVQRADVEQVEREERAPEEHVERDEDEQRAPAPERRATASAKLSTRRAAHELDVVRGRARSIGLLATRARPQAARLAEREEERGADDRRPDEVQHVGAGRVVRERAVRRLARERGLRRQQDDAEAEHEAREP